MTTLTDEQFATNLANVMANPISLLRIANLSPEERRQRALEWARLEEDFSIGPCQFCGRVLLAGLCCEARGEYEVRIAHENERAIIDARQAKARERRIARRALRRLQSAIASEFIRGCYYHMTNNSIWYIHQSNMAKLVSEFNQQKDQP